MSRFECKNPDCPNEWHRNKICPNISQCDAKKKAKTTKTKTAKTKSKHTLEEFFDLLQNAGNPSAPTILWFMGAANGDTEGYPAQKSFKKAAEYLKMGTFTITTKDALEDLCTILANQGHVPSDESDSDSDSESSDSDSD
jgi:hypothetical protein